MIDETSDSCNRICPYCQHSYQVETEDYSSDTRVEECSECGKKYHATDHFEVTHTATPDCELNGEPHDWTSNVRHTFEFCRQCGTLRTIEVESEASK
jgi:ribosomal protein S14